MNPVDTFQPDPAATLRVLPAVGPAFPKRRCKNVSAEAQPERTNRIIIPMEVESGRAVRFHRSGQPFQVWKPAPKYSLEIKKAKPPINMWQELARFYTRVVASISSAHFYHSH